MLHDGLAGIFRTGGGEAAGRGCERGDELPIEKDGQQQEPLQWPAYNGPKTVEERAFHRLVVVAKKGRLQFVGYATDKLFYAMSHLVGVVKAVGKPHKGHEEGLAFGQTVYKWLPVQSPGFA